MNPKQRFNANGQSQLPLHFLWQLGISRPEGAYCSAPYLKAVMSLGFPGILEPWVARKP